MKYVDYKHLDELFDITPQGGGYWVLDGETTTSQEGELNSFYGKKHTEETRERMRTSALRRAKTRFAERQRCANAKKTYLFVSPENSVVRIRGSLNQFCESRGLNNGAMSALHRGQGLRGSKQHKGWRKYE